MHDGRKAFFASRVSAASDAADACLVWVGNTDRYGYGFIKIDGKPRRAHRVAWEMANGRPVPAGLVVRHRCDNPPCVRPDHLIAGTQAENMKDMSQRGRSCRGVRNVQCKLTDEQVRELIAARATESGASIARRFGVSQAFVCNLLAGIRRTNIDRPTVVRKLRDRTDVLAAIKADPSESANSVARRTGAAVSTVLRHRKILGLPSRPVGAQADRKGASK